MDQGRGLTKTAKKVYENPKAKKEACSLLIKFNQENPNVQEKPLRNCSNLSEIKGSPSSPRIIIRRQKNQKPEIIGMCMRDDLDSTVEKFKNRFK